MSYLGSWKIDDYVMIPAACHRIATGAAYDATSITYRVYEDDSATEIVSDTAMSKFDGETGFYASKLQLLSATGFEKGRCYTVLIKATIDGVAVIAVHTFQIEAEVDANSVSPSVLPANLTQIGGDAQSATDLKDFADSGYDPAMHKVEEVTLLTGHTPQTGDNFARLGLPAGVSVSADIAAVKGDTAAILADTGTDGVKIDLAQVNTADNDPTHVGGQIRRTHALAGGTKFTKDHTPSNPVWVTRNEADSAALVTRTRTFSAPIETHTPS